MSREYRAGFFMNDSYDCYVGNLCAAESEEQSIFISPLIFPTHLEPTAMF